MRWLHIHITPSTLSLMLPFTYFTHFTASRFSGNLKCILQFHSLSDTALCMHQWFLYSVISGRISGYTVKLVCTAPPSNDGQNCKYSSYNFFNSRWSRMCGHEGISIRFIIYDWITQKWAWLTIGLHLPHSCCSVRRWSKLNTSDLSH